MIAEEMPQTINASTLSLRQVHALLGIQEQTSSSFASLLSLESLPSAEQQDLQQIQDEFRSYLADEMVSEGLVKFLALAPLLRLAGFYRPSIRLTLEDSIAITVVDEDQTIIGRLDILAVNRAETLTTAAPFWILVIEAKNSTVDVYKGLPQLLTYAFKGLEHQASVWGLTTNGLRYQFVYIEQGNPPTYQLFPDMNLIYPEPATKLLQVLKAICQSQYSIN